MKILHTSDLHLGKRLFSRSRLAEQSEVLEEIVAIVKEKAVDIVLIAGDIFDTPVPPSEAEELFYSFLLALSKHALPVVIAGNHDDATRLRAPYGIAKASGIILTGDEDLKSFNFTSSRGEKVTGGEGYLKIEKGGETLNLAILNYPSSAKLIDLAGGEDYATTVSTLAKKNCECFREGEINIFMSHLFVVGGKEEGELGGSKLVPTALLDIPLCDYIALGHIHGYAKMSKDKNIYYCGAPLFYSFDDDTKNAKRVLIFDTTEGKKEVYPVFLKSGKTLCKVTVRTEEEAETELNKREGELVWLTYEGNAPLSFRAVANFKKKPCYCGINILTEKREVATERRGKSDEELFTLFYESKRQGKKPTADMIDMFVKAVSGEDF